MSKHQALNTFGKSGNPVFGNKFDGDAQFRDLPAAQKMTLEGTVNKTGILLFLTVLSAAISWNFQGPLMSLVSTVGVVTGVIAVSYTHLTLPTTPYV